MRLWVLPRNAPEGWTPFVWLIYLGFYLSYAAASNRSDFDWIIDAVVLTTFLILYFRTFWLWGRRAFPVLAGIVLLGAIVTPRNPGAACFFIYAAAFGYRLGPSRVAFKWIAAIVIIVALEALTIGLPDRAWIPAIVFSLIVGGVNVHFVELGRKDRKLARARRKRSSTWRRLRSASASGATCTICSVIRCR